MSKAMDKANDVRGRIFDEVNDMGKLVSALKQYAIEIEKAIMDGGIDTQDAIDTVMILFSDMSGIHALYEQATSQVINHLKEINNIVNKRLTKKEE